MGVDENVGLEHAIVVLSADHGSPEVPGYLQQMGFEADYIVPSKFDRAEAISALKKRFGIGERLIETYCHPYLYLNRTAIRERGINQAEVESAVANELMKLDGVNLAVSSSGLSNGNLPQSPIVQSVLRKFHAQRSGDIYIVYDPQRFINDFDGLVAVCTHGSPWSYDTFLTIMCTGPGIPARSVERTVHTVGIAPTLSRLLNIKPPSGAMLGSVAQVPGE